MTGPRRKGVQLVLLVDLYNSRRMSANYKKDRAQMESRKFQLEYPVEGVRSYLNCTNKAEIDRFIAQCSEQAENGRYYKKVIAGGAVDSAYVLEAMGLGRYSYEYQIIFDFSDKLDYYLHKLTSCSPGIVRGLADYKNVSYAVLNNDYGKVQDVGFEALMRLDKRVVDYFAMLMLKSQNNGIIGDAACTKDVVYSFYYQLLSYLSNDRDYMVAKLRSSFRGMSFVYRSKNLCSAVISSEFPFTEEVVLRQEGFQDCVIAPRCYKRYEYAAEEVFVCANCRKC